MLYTNANNLLNFEASSFVFKRGGVFVGNVKPTGPFTDATLAVDGKIVAKQLQIQVSSWADKVFSKDYKLMPLKEVEAFVIKYHHLPEIPAEKEILLSGLDMGKLQLLQMQKIEELTLYIIAQEKKIEALQTDLGNIKESLPKTKVNAPIKIGGQ